MDLPPRSFLDRAQLPTKSLGCLRLWVDPATRQNKGNRFERNLHVKRIDGNPNEYQEAPKEKRRRRRRLDVGGRRSGEGRGSR